LNVTPKKKGNLSSGPILQQTPFWGILKEYQGCQVRAYSLSLPARYCRNKCGKDRQGQSSVSGDMLVVLQPIGNGYAMAYVPYGPTLEIGEEYQGPVLEELSEEIQEQLPDECLFIRYDLPWASPWACDPDRDAGRPGWAGPPRSEIQEIRMNFDTQKGNLFKAPTNALPTNTVFIDLEQDKDHLLKCMKPKTRYNIRLSDRKGIRVREVDASQLDKWMELCRETAERNHIIRRDQRYFEAIFAARDKNPDDRASVHLLIAEFEGTPLAGMFLSISKDQATYLYGASSSHQRNRMAPYALQWKAICMAKESGCRYYDMFGVAPSPSVSHPLHGLYRFKTGFGGYLYHRQGCWDYPFKEDLYPVYHAQNLNEAGYHV
jgi:lipid II:glycine glycyltransferase (peptidoglycan interpeptide bridge formation enzyme)